MRTPRTLLLGSWPLLALLTLAACATSGPAVDPHPPRPAVPEGGLLRVDEGGLSLWLEAHPRLGVLDGTGETSAVISLVAWASQDLGATSAILEGSVLETTTTGARRRLEVRLEGAHAGAWLAGHALFVDVRDDGGAHALVRAVARASLAPAPSSEAPDIDVSPWLDALEEHAGVVFRGTVDFGLGASQRRVDAPLAGALALDGVGDAPRRFSIALPSLARAAADPRTPIVFLARTGGRIQRTTAHPTITLVDASSTDGAVPDAWRAPACLDAPAARDDAPPRGPPCTDGGVRGGA